jgi:hypothetical protein
MKDGTVLRAVSSELRDAIAAFTWNDDKNLRATWILHRAVADVLSQRTSDILVLHNCASRGLCALARPRCV